MGPTAERLVAEAETHLGQGLLVAVGSNPPLSTTGQRTRGRVEHARLLLGFDTVQLVNLFALPTYRSGGIQLVGQANDGWHLARSQILDALGGASAVLLAYGLRPPSGPARQRHRSQVEWLNGELMQRELPVYGVGGAPRHPSRWQRYTWRAFPDLPFIDGLREALTLIGEQERRGADDRD